MRTQPKLPGVRRAIVSSTLKGDPQRRPHLEENQLHGDMKPSMLWEHPDGSFCRELGMWGHKSMNRADKAGVGGSAETRLG